MNTATGTILLFFSGIVAFVPERPQANLVNALLINVSNHDQQLRVPLASFQQGQRCPTQDGYCAEVDRCYRRYCECPLRGITVSIPDQLGSTAVLPTEPPGILPTQQNVGSIAWLVSMWHIKPSGARVVPSRIPQNVGGRVSFNWHEAATCRFEEALCNGRRRIFAVRFNSAIAFNPRQAVPETVVFKSVVRSAQARIELRRSGTSAVTLHLNCPADTGCPVLISNAMPGCNDTAVLCTTCFEDRERGEHFREYRRLTNDVFGVAPYRSCDRDDQVDLPNDLPRLCGQGLGPLNIRPEEFDAVSNRVICPATIMTP